MDKYTTHGVVLWEQPGIHRSHCALWLDSAHKAINHPDTDSSRTRLLKFYNFIRTDSMERQHAVQSAVHI